VHARQRFIDPFQCVHLQSNQLQFDAFAAMELGAVRRVADLVGPRPFVTRVLKPLPQVSERLLPPRLEDASGVESQNLRHEVNLRRVGFADWAGLAATESRWPRRR
jgi:hypothetical protein